MIRVPFGNSAEVDAAIDRVRAHLESGGLLVHPTETVYGLGCKLDASSVKKLNYAKGRSESQAALLLVSGFEMLDAWGISLPSVAETLAKACWPGALTMVLPVLETNLLPAVLRPDGGVAVRWTSHRGISQLIDAWGFPLPSTSANKAGEPSAIDLDMVGTFEGDSSILALDAGRLKENQPSTVVDCTGDRVQLIREGPVSREAIQTLIGYSVE